MDSKLAVKMIKAYSVNPPDPTSRISHNFDSIPQQFWIGSSTLRKLSEEEGFIRYFTAAYIDSAKFIETNNPFRNKGLPTILIAQCDTGWNIKNYYDCYDLHANEKVNTNSMPAAPPPVCPKPDCKIKL